MKEKGSKDDLINNEVQKTLDSLNDTEDISASQYFYSKLKANIGSLEQTDTSWAEKFIFNSRLAPVAFTLIILINIFSFSIHFDQKNVYQAENRDQLIEDIENEYMISGSSGWYEK